MSILAWNGWGFVVWRAGSGYLHFQEWGFSWHWGQIHLNLFVVIFVLAVVLGGLRKWGCVCFVCSLHSSVHGSVPDILQQVSERGIAQVQIRFCVPSRSLWKPVSKQPWARVWQLGFNMPVRHRTGSAWLCLGMSSSIWSQGFLGFLRAVFFPFFLLPANTPRGHMVPSGREPVNTGPACPNTCLYCSVMVSIVLPAMLECPVIKDAKYCIAYY